MLVQSERDQHTHKVEGMQGNWECGQIQADVSRNWVIRGWWNELRFCPEFTLHCLCSIKSLPWIKALYLDLMETLKFFQWHSKLGIRTWEDGSDSSILFWEAHFFFLLCFYSLIVLNFKVIHEKKSFWCDSYKGKLLLGG